MKQKIFTITAMFLLSMTLSFASDDNRSLNENIQKNKVENKELSSDFGEGIVSLPMKIKDNKNKTTSNTVKRFFKRSNRKVLKKLRENNLLAPMGVNALVIIGLILFIPGAILSFIGIALIPALILDLVGGTLLVIGLLKMR